MTTFDIIFLTFLTIMMIYLPYVGLHLHKPMFWEKGGLLDKLKQKYKK